MSGGKSKVVAAVFIGMVLGVAAAAGVAWYLMQKRPAVFASKEPVHAAPQVVPQPASAPAVVAPPVTAPVAASSVAQPQQHFEFYKVLTDKSDGTAHKNVTKPAAKPKEHAAAKPQASSPHTATSKELYYVQAGSFPNLDDAEKLKAKLAFSGYEASIQNASIPGKGEWHRVRLGPFNSSEAGKTIAALKQNGIVATQVHAQ